MLDMVIGATIVLAAVVIAPFLILLILNVLLVRKLRSIIPLSPDAGPAAERFRAHGGDRAGVSPHRQDSPGSGQSARQSPAH